MGELGLFFRLADIVFMGKSLVPLGGQNPLEAMRLNCAVVHGPCMTNFSDMVDRMTKSCANLEVADEGQLLKTVDRLLSNPQEVSNIAATAKLFAEAEEHVLDDVVEELQPFLKNLPGQGKTDASA